MDASFLKKLYENHQLEAEKAKGGLPNSIWETYSSFANTSGGFIVLGVEENDDFSFKECGLKREDVEKLKRDFWNAINNKTIVSKNILINDDVKEERINDSYLLFIHVPKARRQDKPIYIFDDLNSGTYKRNGDGDYHCDNSEIRAMLAETIDASLDSSLVEEADISWLSKSSIDAYKNMFKSEMPSSPWLALNDADFLLRIGALNEKNNKLYPTIAGLLFFGFDWRIRTIYPNYFLDYTDARSFSLFSRYSKRIVTYSGDWSGNLFEFIMNVATDISLKLPKPFSIETESLLRKDNTLLLTAVREGLANACSNADFRFTKGIKVTLENKGLRIENPGLMLISKNQALKGGETEPRNQFVLSMLTSIGIGDRQGWGIPSMNEAMKECHYSPLSINETTCPDRTTLFLPIDFEKEQAGAPTQRNCEKFNSFEEYLSSLPANQVFTRQDVAKALDKSLPSASIYLKEALVANKIAIAKGYKIGKYVKK